MSLRTTKSSASASSDDYFELAMRHPLKGIRNDRELKAAYAVLDPLSVIDEDKLTPGKSDYLFALTELVWAYEQRRHPIDLRHGDQADGIDILKLLMEERNMTASDLGRLLGKRQLGSAILRRERQLSKAHVVKLAEFFSVSTDLLLRSKAAGDGQAAA
jgi:antitoxin component HigA of HigAB toxin-antitoxin module